MLTDEEHVITKETVQKFVASIDTDPTSEDLDTLFHEVRERERKERQLQRALKSVREREGEREGHGERVRQRASELQRVLKSVKERGRKRETDRQRRAISFKLQEAWCSPDTFKIWIRAHPNLSSFTQWLFSEEMVMSFTAEPDPPTFYETLSKKYERKLDHTHPVTTPSLSQCLRRT